MTENKVVLLCQKEEIDDPLTSPSLMQRATTVSNRRRNRSLSRKRP